MSEASPDDALIRLASLIRVAAHRRENKGGGSTQVSSYVRKHLDSFGGGSSKTKTGVFTTSTPTVEAHPPTQATPEVPKAITDHLDPHGVAKVGEERAWNGLPYVKGEKGWARKPVKGGGYSGFGKKVTEADLNRGDAKVRAADAKHEAEYLAKRKKEEESSRGGRHARFSVESEDALVRLAGRLDFSPKHNWVEDAGGLPKYIEDIAIALIRDHGFTRERAIATAVNRVKKWAAGVGNTNADTKAKAAAAVAQWEALKAKSKAKTAVKDAVKKVA